MRRILICTGVLGGGTALTFAAAAVAASLFPSGGLVYAQQPNAVVMRGGIDIAVPAPVPAPGVQWAPAPDVEIPLEPVVVDDQGAESAPG